MKAVKEPVDELQKQEEQERRRRLEAMLQAEYPADCEDLEEDFALVIDHGIARAESYGILEEKDITLYFHVMFALAFNFDTNPEFPWACEILKQKDLPPAERVLRVAQRAQEELESQEP